MQTHDVKALKIAEKVRKMRGNLTQSEFASRLLYSREYISEVERGVRPPNPRFLRALESLENASPPSSPPPKKRENYAEKVRNLRGSMTLYDFSRKVGFSLNYVNQIENGHREPGPRFLQMLKTFESPALPFRASASSPPSGYLRIPRLAAYASAGVGVPNDDFPEVLDSLDLAEWRVRALFGRIPKPNELAVVQVRGDSMAPDYEDGDAVLIDTSRARFDGDGIYLFTLNGQAMIKRLQMLPAGLRVMSSNPRYESYTIPPTDTETLAIAGRAGASLHLRGL